MRKVFESRALQDEDRMSKLEEELKDARYNHDHDFCGSFNQNNVSIIN